MKIIGFKRSNAKKRRYFINTNQLRITRSTKEPNPLTAYNGQVTLFDANTLIKHGDMPFIGGDTTNYEYNFGLKVAGSVVECPMKILFYNNASSLLEPTSPLWNETTGQVNIDSLKNIDGNAYTGSTSFVGCIRQFLVELDLTPLCNAQYGGSNAALKSALKSIQCDVWAKGSGSNGGVATDGVQVKMWWHGGAAWDNTYMKQNTTSAISKITISANAPQWIGTSSPNTNKVFALVNAPYPSDGTIASSVSLDYLNITIQTQRTPDVVQPIPVNLPRYWGALVKVSPNWADSPKNYLKVFSLKKDTFNNIYLELNNAIKNWSFVRQTNGSNYQSTVIQQTNIKNQFVNFLVEHIEGKLKIRRLNNNDIIVSSSLNTFNSPFYGQCELSTLCHNGNSAQLDGFLEHLSLFQIPQTGLTDAQAEYMLKGYSDAITRNGQELVVNGDFSQGGTGWTVASGTWSFASGSAVLTPNALGQYMEQIVDVFPNSQYILTANPLVLNQGIELWARDINNTSIGGSPLDGIGVSKQTVTITTPNNCVKLRIKAFVMFSSGTFTFDNISLKYVKPSVPIEAPNPNLVDMSKFTLHANAVRNGDVITLNANGNYQETIQTVSVLPNNVYELKAIVIGSITGGVPQVILQYYYNNVPLGYSANVTPSVSSRLITMPNNCNRVRVICTNNTVTTGTFTFSNIKLARRD